MIALQSVLAATDFSADARLAAERAALLAAATGMRRGTLLHVLEPPWTERFARPGADLAGTRQARLDDAARELAGLAEDIRERRGFALTPEVRAGRALEQILAAGAEFDLLAVGARGSHPLRELALGTTAQRLLRTTRQPVLVVKRAPEAPYRRVLVAVDFSPHAQRALTCARALAPQADISLVHVYEAVFEGKMQYAGVGEDVIEEYRAKARHNAAAQMAQFVAEAGAGADTLPAVIEPGYAPARLREQVRALDADLVVAGRHGKSLTEQLLLGSVTLHLLAESPCDVLVTQ